MKLPQTQDPKEVARAVYKLLKMRTVKSIPVEQIPIEWPGSWSEVVEASEGYLSLTRWGLVELTGAFRNEHRGK